MSVLAQRRVRLGHRGGVTIGMVAPADGVTVAALEEGPVTSLWVGGHVASPNQTGEAIVRLTRLVTQTTRVTCGTAVLLLPLYPPVLAAKQLADLDVLSGGRVCAGLGVGGEHAADYLACEIPLPERGERLDEGIEILRRTWRGPLDFSGRHHRFTGLEIGPRPIQPGGPPVLVAGRTALGVRRAARVADGWLPYLLSPRRYAQLAGQLRAEAAATGRDLAGFEWLLYAPVRICERPDRARQAQAEASDYLSSLYRQDFSALVPKIALVGDRKYVADRIAQYAEAGVRHLVAMPTPRCDHVRQAELLADAAGLR